MKNNNDHTISQGRNFSRPIQIISSVYGLLYLAFFIFSFLPPDNDGNPISDSPNYDPWNFEMIWVKIQFIIFLVGFYYSWKSRLISGLIYLFWYGGLVGLAYYSVLVVNSDGNAVGLGFPMLIIAIILVITGLKKRQNKTVVNNETKS